MRHDKLKSKSSNALDYLKRRETNIKTRHESVVELRQETCDVVQLRVSQLITHIFPVETLLADEHPDTRTISTSEITPLLTSSEGGGANNNKYTIVDYPWLPGSGDYSAFSNTGFNI